MELFWNEKAEISILKLYEIAKKLGFTLVKSKGELRKFEIIFQDEIVELPVLSSVIEEFVKENTNNKDFYTKIKNQLRFFINWRCVTKYLGSYNVKWQLYQFS